MRGSSFVDLMNDMTILYKIDRDVTKQQSQSSK